MTNQNQPLLENACTQFNIYTFLRQVLDSHTPPPTHQPLPSGASPQHPWGMPYARHGLSFMYRAQWRWSSVREKKILLCVFLWPLWVCVRYRDTMTESKSEQRRDWFCWSLDLLFISSDCYQNILGASPETPEVTCPWPFVILPALSHSALLLCPLIVLPGVFAGVNKILDTCLSYF